MARETHGRIQGRAGVKLRDRRLQRTNYLCEDCLEEGKTTLATIVDHIHPLSLGGQDVDENTRNLCDPHNEKRTAEQFGFKHKQPIGLDGWPE
jgi:5-methylcytosine-specific restriction protein A